ncbi:S-4TM family putative pore-forming effector [Umezawaea sp. NPDC059074]|uniref:S-4TM family putative pore-forming effector n=1 Tax=Umezawaea sp. NPDC059074 TaxID=3346716 RepID=UPI0036996416
MMSSAPAPPFAHTINVRQNQPIFLEMLHAADTAHVYAQRWETARAIVALASSCGALVAAFWHTAAKPMSIMGGLGTAALLAMTFLSQARTKEATKIQERFDYELFGLPATDEFKPFPTDEELGALAQKCKRDKRDWYVDVAGLPQAYAILLCQRQNLQWDWPLRRQWASLLLKVAVTWLVAGLTIALVMDWTTRELLLRWLIPSLPGLALATNLVVKNRQVAREKQQLALQVDERLSVLPAITVVGAVSEEIHAELLAYCRVLQDRIYRQRNHAERVPGFLYRRSKTKNENLAQTAASRLKERLLGHVPEA